MPEIEVLTKRVAELSSNVNFWNVVMLWGLALAALAALLIVGSTRLVVVRSGQLSTATDQLNSAKDRQLQYDLKLKDVEIGNLKIRSDTAEAGIAAANQRAAEAIRSAEQEKLARVNIELRMAWRHIEPKLHDAAVAVLTPHKGSVVRMTLVGGDPETIAFWGEIEGIFKAADWHPEVNRVMLGDHGDSGLLCDVDERTAAGRALSDVCSSLRATVRKMRLTDEIGVIWVSAKPPA